MAAIAMPPASVQGEKVIACNFRLCGKPKGLQGRQVLQQRDSTPRRSPTIRAPPAKRRRPPADAV